MKLERKQIERLIENDVQMIFRNEYIISCSYISLINKKLIEGDSKLIKASKMIIDQVDKDVNKQVLDIIESADVEDIKEIVTDASCGEFYESHSNDLSSSKKLSEIIIDILEVNEGESLYDMGCGYGNFLSLASKELSGKDVKLFGSEISERYTEIAQMVFSILGVNAEINVYDALQENHASYDKAYVFPPFGIRIKEIETRKSKLFDYNFSLRNSSEWVYVDSLLADLKDDARACALLTQKAMYNPADKEYRDYLLSNNYIEGIIDLPSHTIVGTHLKATLLVLKKNSKQIKVLDASEYKGETIKGRKIGISDLERGEIVRDYNYSISLGYTSESLLGSNNLSAESITKDKQVTVKEGVKLSEIAEVLLGSQYTSRNFEDMFTESKTGYRILTSRDIEGGTINWDNLQNIDYRDPKAKFDKFAIKKNDLILTSKSSTVKVAVVDIDLDDKVLATGGMFIVRPNIEKISPVCLKLFLDSYDGQNTLASIQKGATIKSLSFHDLPNILIPKMEKEQQEYMEKKYYAVNEQIRILKNQLAEYEKTLDQLYASVMSPKFEVIHDIDISLNNLSIGEEKILRLRYGMDDGIKKTPEEVGKLLGMTKERVIEIETRALKRIKHIKDDE